MEPGRFSLLVAAWSFISGGPQETSRKHQIMPEKSFPFQAGPAEDPPAAVVGTALRQAGLEITAENVLRALKAVKPGEEPSSKDLKIDGGNLRCPGLVSSHPPIFVAVHWIEVSQNEMVPKHPLHFIRKKEPPYFAESIYQHATVTWSEGLG